MGGDVRPPAAVTPILAYQSTCIRWFWCRDCGDQCRLQVAVTMQARLLTCPHCGIDGFLTPAPRKF